jgi:hypothetical protein
VSSLRCIVGLALLYSAAAARADEPPDPARPDLAKIVEQLKLRLDAQDAELATLRRDVDAQARGVIRAGGLRLSFGGFVQADGVLYDQASQDEVNPSTGDPLNNTRFLIRRARLRVQADYRYLSAVLEFDGNTMTGSTARITNAEVSIQWPPPRPSVPPYVMATFGLLRIPFGFEVKEKDYIRLFLERSNIMRALFPGEFDLGIRVQGGWRFLRYQVAVMNGHPSGDKQFALRDPTQSKDFLGRVGIDTLLVPRVALQAGLSGLYGTGFHQGTPATKNTIFWNDMNLDGQVDPTELMGVLGQPATASQTFTRYAFGGDLRVVAALPRLGALTLYGEVIWAINLDRGLIPADPVGIGRDLREFGWYVAFTQELTRWAMFGIRYDRYDPDADAINRVGAALVPRDLTFSTLAIVAAACWPPYGRLTLEYDRNTNALGITPSGAPTTLDGHVLTLRAQVVY